MSPAPDGLVFWLIAAAMTAIALAFVVPWLLARRSPRPDRRTALNAAVCRGNLVELELERESGQLTDHQYALVRDEMERRLLLEAADESADTTAPGTAPRRTAIALLVALPALAFGLYALFGEPGAVEVATDAASASALPAPMSSLQRENLTRHLARNTRDGRGWILLARLDFAADRFGEAAESYRRALALSPKIAADAGVWCEYADALGMAQGGVLAGQPREHVMRALALDPVHPKALEMAGSAAYEQGDFAAAVNYWHTLLPALPERSARHRELAAAIARAEQLAAAAAGSGANAR